MPNPTFVRAEQPLRPCPFCGHLHPQLCNEVRRGYERTPYDPDARSFYVFCPSCACQGGWMKTPGNAVARWNMRHET